MLSRLKTSRKPIMTTMRVHNQFGTFDKIILVIRSLLNKMSNEDRRSFAQNTEEYNKNAPMQVDKAPESELEAERKFQDAQQELSGFEKGRLQRIDDVTLI